MKRFVFMAVLLLMAFGGAQAWATSMYCGRTANGYFQILGKDGTTSASSNVSLQFDAYWPTTTPYNTNRAFFYVSLLNPNNTGVGRSTSANSTLLLNGFYFGWEMANDTIIKAAITEYSNDRATSSSLLAPTNFTSPVVWDQAWHRFLIAVDNANFTVSVDGTVFQTAAIDQANKPSGDYFALGIRNSLSTTDNSIRFDNIVLNGQLVDNFESYTTNSTLINSAWVQQNTTAVNFLSDTASNSTLSPNWEGNVNAADPKVWTLY